MHTTPLYTQIDLLRFSKVYIKRKFPCDDDWAVQYVWGMIGKEGDNCERFFCILLMFVLARGSKIFHNEFEVENVDFSIYI